MAITNRDRVGKAIDCLGTGLAPFVERELKAVFGDNWKDALQDGSSKAQGSKKIALNLADPQLLLGSMWNHWNDVFSKTLGQAERSLVSELRDVRNRWAHNEAFTGNDSYRALDSVGRLLSAVSAPQAAEVEQMRMDLLRVQFDEQRRSEMRKASFQPTEGKPQGGLLPWREVVTQAIRVLSDGQSVLVKPDIAAAQMQTEWAEQTKLTGTTGADSKFTLTGSASDGQAKAEGISARLNGEVISPTPAPQLRRFHASVTIDPLRLGRDASQIAAEIVQHLTCIVGAAVEITLEIHAQLPEGAHEKLVRDVTENCRTLHFDNYGFEEG